MNLRRVILAVTAISLAANQVQAQAGTNPPANPAPAFVAPPQTTPVEAELPLPQVTIAPAPAWVVPVSATAPEGKGGAVIRLLDAQIRSDGQTVQTFQHSVLKFNSATALQMATNFTVQWQPAHGGATVHSLLIHRDGKTINLLTSGAKFTTLRREAQLGMFQIDGMLTAFTPISDLRVGDELEFSFTVQTSNAVLAGNTEQEYFTMPGARIDQLYLSESHPKGSAVRARWGAALPPQRQSAAGGFVSTVASANPFMPPKYDTESPIRLLDRGTLQISSFASWTDVAKVMYPVFAEAATLPPGSPVQAEIDKIAAAHADPLGRANAALQLVQGQVRYLAELQGLGGYKPIAANSVWQRRMGDCKGKTILLLAMLHGLGIEAEPLLVSTKRGDGTDAALPMPGRFDHVIVHARIGGKDYWLDGTRRDSAPLDELESPDFLWGLPLSATSAGLIPIPAGEYRRPQTEWRMTLDATGGIDTPAKTTGTAILRGDDAQLTAQAIEVLPPDDLDKFLKGLWTGQRSGLTVDKIEHRTDSATGAFTLTMTGTAKIDWNRSGKNPKFRYLVNGANLGSNLISDRDDPPPADSPVVVGRRNSLTSEVILLPDGGAGFTLEGGDIDETIGGIRYVRSARLEGNRFEMTATQSSPRLELTLAQAQQADKASDDLFERSLYLRLPATVAAKAVGENADSANAEIEELISNGKQPQARALLDARLSAAPRDAELLALSGYAHYIAGNLPQASRDLDAALAISPRQPRALRTKAQLLFERGATDDALLLLDRAILVSPEDDALYALRSIAREASGDLEGALADRTILVGKFPQWRGAAWDKARLELKLGRPAAALATAREYQTTAKDKADALWLVAGVLVQQGATDEAKKELRGAETGGPNATTAEIRLTYGLSGTPDQVLADALVIVRTDPTAQIPDRALDLLGKDPKRMARLLAAYDAEAAKPGAAKARIAIAKGHAQRAAGDPAALNSALGAAEAARPNDAEMRNEACWQRAIWRLDLTAARASCEAALGPARLGVYVDSLAMVELQSGNYPLAIRLYTEALRTLPDLAPTLYGRGIARLRSGVQGGQADLARARAIDPWIDETFARYGLAP